MSSPTGVRAEEPPGGPPTPVTSVTAAPVVPAPAAPADPAEKPLASRGPAEALAELLAGNRRFIGGQPLHGHDVSAAEVSGSVDQQPYAVVLGCIDSRVPLEAIFDQTFGAICVVRSGGHVLDRAVLGSVEFAVSELSVPLIVVLGHERCGAVASTVAALRGGQRPGGALAYLIEQIAPSVTDVGPEHPEVQPRAVRRHTARTVRELRDNPAFAAVCQSGQVDIIGAVYDICTGRVDLLD